METSEASSNADHEMKTPDEEENQANIRCVHLFNCDQTYKLDVVEKLFKAIEPKLNFAFSIQSRYFVLRDMSQVCENIIPDQIKVDDVAVFVVHAHESRLSINEENAGIGYAKIYKALLQATGEKVLVVIGGDDSYKDSAEEQSSFLSRWARRKISSQFSEEYLDGRKSFIFSWDKQHRSIHEEALLHYFNPDKKDEKFVPEKKGDEVPVTQVVPIQKVETQERAEADVKRSRTEGHSSGKVQTETEALQTGEKGREETELQQQEDEKAHLPHPSKTEEKDENMADETEEYVIVQAEDSLPKTKPKRARVEGMDTSPPQERIAILIRDESDINTIEEVFGGAVLLSIIPVTDPRVMKDLLLLENTPPVRSCFIIVESTKLEEELLTKSSSTVYQELLKTTNRIVEKKILVIICSKGKSLTPGEEENIRATIMGLLGKKGLVFWCKEKNKTKRSSFSRSHSLPASDPAPSTHVERPINPEEFTLVFKTRLRLGKISYDEKDVKVWLEGWRASQEMVENLLTKWHTVSNVELSVYRENKTGNESTVVTEDLKSRVSGLGESFKGALGRVGLPSCVGEKVADGTNAIGAGVTSVTEVWADVINVLGAITQVGSNLMSGSVPGIELPESIASEEGPPDGCSNISSADRDPLSPD
ncbi:unnamed protein product [Porites lobata]|uniref:Uncharacterized protein n=1 Tax=Porites lobata TaxID=104759 RepID=A0ABN8QHS4_9CNID|nr:unnamed protein product [Porites lobata]